MLGFPRYPKSTTARKIMSPWQTSNNLSRTGVSRRTVTKAMAWAVPAVAIATTAPLAAASPICLDSDVCFGGIDMQDCSATALPRRYWACVTFTNNSGVPVDVTFEFDLVTSSNGTFVFAGGETVPANSTACFLVEASTNTDGDGAGNRSQGDIRSLQPGILRWNQRWHGPRSRWLHGRKPRARLRLRYSLGQRASPRDVCGDALCVPRRGQVSAAFIDGP